MGTSRTYQELLSTGNLSLIPNDEIRIMVVDYYTNMNFTDIYVENLRTNYASYVNSLKVYNPKSR